MLTSIAEDYRKFFMDFPCIIRLLGYTSGDVFLPSYPPYFPRYGGFFNCLSAASDHLALVIGSSLRQSAIESQRVDDDAFQR